MKNFMLHNYYSLVSIKTISLYILCKYLYKSHSEVNIIA